MYGSRLTSKGQVTVPKVVRQALALHPGDRIRFVIHEDRTVSVEAESVDLRTLRGAVKPGRRGVSIEQMGDAIRQGATDTKSK